MSLCCDTVCGWGVWEGTMPFVWLSASLQSLPPLPTSKLGPSGADSWVGWFVYILGPCGSLQQTLLWGWEFLLPPQPPQVFSVSGLRLYFPALELWVVLFLTPQLFLLVYLHAMWDHLVLQPPPCQMSFLPWLPVYFPPTGLDECFFFNSLVVRLPYRSIFWDFCLFFAFKFVVVLLLVVQGGTVYLPAPPSWLEVPPIILYSYTYWSGILKLN